MLILDTDPSLYLSFGEESVNTLEYGRERLGDVYVKPNLGHDGRLFYIAAHDPFIGDPATYEELFERPIYRAQRMLLPVLAAPALAAGEWALVWWMLILNVIAIGGGTLLTARLAEELDLSAWFGLSFLFNPGVWAELNAGGSGAISWALAVGGLLLIVRGRHWPSVLLITLAALSREATLLIAVGAAVALWGRDRPRAVQLAAVPILVVSAWAVYVRVRLGEPVWASQSHAFDWPFIGLVEAAGEWIEIPDAVRALAGATYALILIRFAALARRVPHLLGWAVGGFVLMAPFLSSAVWFDVWDISRAILPVVTAFVILAGVEYQRTRGRPVEP
jgi:hypothetical protein